jgi:hypothetical protein
MEGRDMPTNKTKELANDTGSESEKHADMALRNPERIATFLSDEPESDSRVAILNILDRVMSADSVDDILADDTPEAWEDHLDEPFTLTGGFAKYRSADKYINDGATILKKYVQVQAVNDNGESLVLTCGGFKVVAQLERMHETGKLADARVKLRSKTTGSGYEAYSLVKA